MGNIQVFGVKVLGLGIHRKTWRSEEMMMDSVMRFRDCKAIPGEDMGELGEDTWELGKDLLNTWWGREEGGTTEGGVRQECRVEDDGVRIVGRDNLGLVVLTRSLKCWRKSAPNLGTDTGASWKVQE